MLIMIILKSLVFLFINGGALILGAFALEFINRPTMARWLASNKHLNRVRTARFAAIFKTLWSLALIWFNLSMILASWNIWSIIQGGWFMIILYFVGCLFWVKEIQKALRKKT